MYTAYFGLSEAPFTIAPDPAYLFMSDRHREALSHLSYGLGDNGGFVLLTGEVGTGKTTISRTVMEKLPENTQASFILNPTLSCEELLACICDNLKIRYKKTGATLKYLTDKIQAKLVKNHESDINTLLIIDEAQHLKPEVLEQLRLLTNLETNTKKLLQVILIGQPELQQLLQRRDLRQLAQRITARYHLLPLTKAELNQYVKHRLSVAHCHRDLFNPSAISALHRISKGIPRVVNLLCDRALIIGYGKNDAVIGKKIIQQAALEALGDYETELSFWQSASFKYTALGIAFSSVVFAGFWFDFQQNINEISTFNTPATSSEGKAESSITTKNEPLTEELKKKTEFVDEASNQGLSAKPEKQGALAVDNTLRLETQLSQVTSIEPEKVAHPPQEEKPRILGYQPEKLQQAMENAEFDIVAEPGVSADLLSRFKEAIDETDALEDSDNDETSANILNEKSYLALHEMPPELQNALPTLQFEMHIFATEGQGWVRVNGKDLKEGEQITAGLQLSEIHPQHVVLAFTNHQFDQEKFTMPALSSW